MPSLLLSRLRNRRVRNRLRGKEVHPLALANLTALDHLCFNQRARSLRYVVLDLETTGLSLTRDRVVSVGAFRLVEGRILLGDVFNSLVDPGRSIPSSAVKIHGIVPSMVARAPLFPEVFDQFLRYLGTDILVGYNVWFDLHFMNTYMQQNYGFPLQNLVIDVQSMCPKVVFPSYRRSYRFRFKGNQDLDSAAKQLGVEIYERHTALGDALATAMIFQRILVELEKTGSGRLRNLLSAGRGR
ncbi:MAG: 3'-5' exonuclease [Deltaproteobacteria bacterium]|nr:3'-5' exonuclease [Deltaproteobacteria bacterium]